MSITRINSSFPNDGYIFTSNNSSTNSPTSIIRNLNVETRSTTRRNRLTNDIQNETLSENNNDGITYLMHEKGNRSIENQINSVIESRHQSERSASNLGEMYGSCDNCKHKYFDTNKEVYRLSFNTVKSRHI